MAEVINLNPGYDYAGAEELDRERQEAARLRFDQRFARLQVAQGKDLLKKEAVKAAKKVGTKALARIVNVAAGSTVIGLVVTFLLMNTQLILGNLAGLPFFKEIELDWWEIVIIVLVDLLLALVLLLILFLIYIGAAPLTVKFGLLLEGVRALFGR